jgi:hypothetical protein
VIAVLLTILTVTAAGLPLARLADRQSRPASLAGLALLFGTGAAYLVMLGLSVAGVRWSLPAVAIALLAVSAAALAAEFRRSPRAGAGTPTGQRLPATGNWQSIIRGLVDFATGLTFVGYLFYVTLAPLWEWDFWAIWGLKARVFFESGGIDWRFLDSPLNAFCHPDYPLLVSLNFDLAALAQGGWSDRWLGLLYVAWAVAVTLIVRDLLRDELPPLFASAGGLVTASIAATRFVGLAEGALIAFGAAAILLIRRGLRGASPESVRNGAILLGLAASTKNEGMALLVASAIGIALSRPRRAFRAVQLWPAAIVAAPWLLLRAAHHLPTDLASGSMLDRVQGHLAILGQILRWLSLTLPNAAFWIALLVCWIVLMALRSRQPAESDAARDGDRFLILTTVVQLLFYFASYLVTPNDVHWHIVTSWTRLVSQIAVPISVLTVIRLSRLIGAQRPSNASPELQALSPDVPSSASVG